MAEQRVPVEEKAPSLATKFENPDDIVRDKKLSQRKKSEALNTGEQDAWHLMTAMRECRARKND
jgi:hypothetical protein